MFARAGNENNEATEYENRQRPLQFGRVIAKPKQNKRNNNGRDARSECEPGNSAFVGIAVRIFWFARHFCTVVAGVAPAGSGLAQPRRRLPLRFINHIAADAGKTRFCSSPVPPPPFARYHRFAPALFVSGTLRLPQDSSLRGCGVHHRHSLGRDRLQ